MLVSTRSLKSKIAYRFEELYIPKGGFLLKEGRIGGYFFLAEGFMRAFTHDPDGNEVTSYFYAKHSMVFEASSFFLKLKSPENIQALTDCHGYITSFDNLNLLFHSAQQFREFARTMLVKEFTAYKKRTLSMINKRAEERYIDLLNNHPEIFQYAQLKQIASYLGITDSSLSRIRKEFSKK